MDIYQAAKYVLVTLTGMMIASFAAFFFLTTFYTPPEQPMKIEEPANIKVIQGSKDATPIVSTTTASTTE